MADQSPVDRELRRIRTCFVSTSDGDIVAAFAIDGRRYTDPRQARQTYDEAWDAMSRHRVACEWETRTATPNEPLSPLPSWEEYRKRLDMDQPAPRDGS